MKRSKLKPNFFQQGGYSPVQYSSSGFIPTYAGAPLEETEKIGTGLSSLYHQNIADLTKLDIMNANRKVKPGDEADSEKYNAYLKTQLGELAKQGDYENMTLKANVLAREYFNNPDIKAMNESRAEFEKYEALREKATVMGKRLVLGLDPNEHQTIKYDDKGRKVYDIFRNTAQLELAKQPVRAEIADNLKPDASPMTQAQIGAVAPSLSGYILTGKLEGITGGMVKDPKTGKLVPAGKVGQLLQSAVNTYAGTEAGVQERAQEIEAAVNAGATQEEAEATADTNIRQKMFDEMMLRTYTNIEADYLRNHVLEDMMARKALAEQQGTPLYATGETVAATNPLVDLMDEVDDVTGLTTVPENAIILKDAKTGKELSEAESRKTYQNLLVGVASMNESGAVATIEDELAKAGLTARARTAQETVAANAKLNKQHADTAGAVDKVLAGTIADPAALTSIQSQYPNWSSMSPEGKRVAVVKMQKEIAANKANITTPVLLQTQEQVMDQGKMINYIENIPVVTGNELAILAPKELKGGSYKNLNGWTGVQAALEDIAGKLNLDTDKLKFSGIKQGTSLGNPYGVSGAATTLITVSDGKKSVQVPLLAQPNQQLQAIMHPLNKAWMAANTGKLGESQPIYWPNYDANFTVENYPTFENGKWEAKSRVILPDKVAKQLGVDVMDFNKFTNLWYQDDHQAIDAYRNTFIQ